MSAGRKTALFREVNERIGELLRIYGADEEADFLCECPLADCARRVTLSRADFERIRAAGAFVVSPDCGRWALETERTADYVVVSGFLPPLAALRAAAGVARSRQARLLQARSLPEAVLRGRTRPVPVGAQVSPGLSLLPTPWAQRGGSSAGSSPSASWPAA